MKEDHGSDITIFVSGSVTQQLAKEEYMLRLTLVVLCDCKRLFQNISRMEFKLMEARNFESVVVILHYR